MRSITAFFDLGMEKISKYKWLPGFFTAKIPKLDSALFYVAYVAKPCPSYTLRSAII